MGEAIRKHLLAEDVGTEGARKFLGLPKGKRFNAAGMIYAATLEMLWEAINALAGVMEDTVLKTTRPANHPPDPESDKAVIRAQKLLKKYGFRLRITKIVPVKKPKKK